MKWLIASDIHGSASWCQSLLERFEEEKADRLLLLGDLLYHGPRNALPDGYETMSAADLLNARKDKILCVHGNCDAEVDQMVLDFPITENCRMIFDANLTIAATHGHIYDEGHLPPVRGIDVLLGGHTHVPACVDHGSFVYMNPGSVSIPKGGSDHSYMTLENGIFTWKRLPDGTAYQSFAMKPRHLSPEEYKD